MMDVLDAQILHALELAPRAPFRRIANAVDASEQSVARRYHRMRRAGVMRVVGLVNPRVHGDTQWVTRIHAKPDRMPQLAEALARRSEVTHANILSGGTELVCVIRAPVGESGDGLLLQQLPRTAAVLDISVDLLLHAFGEPPTAPWSGYGHQLTGEQTAQILDGPAGLSPSGRPPAPTAQDQALFDVLADDGRAPQALMVQRTGWSVARVARRMADLESAGTLLYDIDLLPEQLGFRLNAMLWLDVAPQHLHQVGEVIAAHREIAFAGAISGRRNLLAIAICRDVDDLYRYLTEQLAAVDHIHACEVSIRTQRLKQSASLISRGRLVTARRS